MPKKTRTEITIQTRQTIIVRPLRGSFQSWCEQCGDVVLALTEESAIALLRIPLSTLYSLLDAGKLHVVMTDALPAAICCNSLSSGESETQIQIKGEEST